MANRKIKPKRTDVDEKDLVLAILPPRTRYHINRRVRCAQMLIDGKTYAEIQEALGCSTAFIANIVKRLKANEFIY